MMSYSFSRVVQPVQQQFAICVLSLCQLVTYCCDSKSLNRISSCKQTVVALQDFRELMSTYRLKYYLGTRDKVILIPEPPRINQMDSGTRPVPFQISANYYKSGFSLSILVIIPTMQRLHALRSLPTRATFRPQITTLEGFHFFSYPFAHFWSTGANSILHSHRTLATASLTPDAPAHSVEKFVNRCLDFTTHSPPLMRLG
ncbi:hypothetical protein MSAN_02402600 [Mycena sanguinolenta]|uniref:Uncharacterized protein n=1 Tax=Mycena sanguinolenta TaxID=230812 RepID=A0A8H6X461_9AGAR|nr:hypothetical protein MSAN_02402600 [Mycena sanguinolenta]